MKKSCSTVIKLFSILLVGFLLVLGGEVGANDKDKKKEENSEMDGKIRACEKAGSPADQQKCINNLIKSISGDDCKEATKAFQTARKEFSAACEKAGISGNCIEVVKKCQRCMAGGEGEGGSGCDAPEISDATGLDGSGFTSERLENMSSNLSIGSNGWDKAFDGVNLDKVRIKYGKCPALAGTDYKSLKKEVEEGQKKIDDEKKKIQKIQEEMQKIQTDQQEEHIKNEEKIQEAQEKWQQKRDDIDKKFFEGNEAVMKELQQMREANEQKKTEITNLILRKNEEKIKRDQAVSALKLKCNEIALTQVQRLQGSDYEKMKSSMHTAGGFNDLMSRSGLSNREQYQAIAKKNYTECLKSNIFTEGQSNIDKSYRQALAVIDSTMTKLNEAIERANQEMDRKVQVNLGQKRLEYDRDIDRADAEFNNVRNNAVKRQQMIDTKTINQLNLKNQELANAQVALQREERYLAEKQKLLALKRQFTDGDTDAKPGSVGAALTAFDQAEQEASAMQAACCENNKDPKCSAARSFSSAVFDEANKQAEPTSKATGTGGGSK